MGIKANVRPDDGRKARLYYLDNAKGIAILLVVLTHVVLNCDSNLNFTGAAWKYFVNTVYIFHMQLFFIISGMLFHETWANLKKTDIKRKLADKTIALMVPYAVFSLLYGIMKMVLSSMAASEISVNDLLFLWIKPLSVYWYMYALALLYILFGALRYCGYDLNSAPWKLVSLGILIAAGMGVQIVPIPTFLYKTVIYRVIRYAPYFALGIVLNVTAVARYAANIHTRKLWIAGTVVACFAAGLLNELFPESRWWTVVKYLASFVLPYMIILSCFLLTKKRGWLAQLGSDCMPVYLMHVPVIVVMKAALQRMGTVSDWALFCLISGIAVAAPLLIQRVLRRCKPADFILYPNQYWRYGGKNGGRERGSNT